MGECVAIMIWQIVDCSIRRISFKDPICHAGDSYVRRIS
jgi:hypothetical protein